ncbi:MAG: sigma-54-dependent Fis family transcriptional regulator [Phycisphaerales bacterium]|nr:sigma-54-dependent Fis family transcriptional regulator [Phycisphaerales bacterium]
MARILVIDDEDNLRFTIRRSLVKAGHAVTEAQNLGAAREANRKNDFELVLSDVMLGPENGLDFVRELRGDGFDGVIVVMTAFTNVDDAVSAMRDGADDYLSKPLSLAELGLQVDKWIEHRRLKRRVQLYERLEQTKSQQSDVVGQSPKWKHMIALADRMAAIPLGDGRANVPSGAEATTASLPCILLTGETGAGKGVMARYIHQRAVQLAARSAGRPEADPPFVHVNCSALPATLVEGELFGHEKGAFTDARDARAGLFEMADGGTIFLDEISEMPLELQAKLLLVVEHGVFRRVGGSKERHVRVRVIAASNQDLDARAAAGAFRRDLLYRLNAFELRIPALRDRTGDALLIADSALERWSRRYGRADMRFHDLARTAIAAHAWPGNVRELVNSVQRAVMLCEGHTIHADDLGLGEAAAPDQPHPTNGFHAAPFKTAPANGAADHAHPGRPGSLVFDFVNGPYLAEDVEKELVIQALRHTQGNVSRAAKLIGMQRSSLRYRIERYQLDSLVAEMVNR